MTTFETLYELARPFTLPLHQRARRDLRDLVRSHENPSPELLDVGGRKSHCTIGLPCTVTVTDVPRETQVQETLHLGINDGIIEQTKRRRSNITDVVLDDMTRTQLPEKSYDIISAIEVLEHVEQDDDFVRNVARLLRPGGTFYLTTPNGDFVENHNPDHKRHYRRQQLRTLLETHLDSVRVEYAVLGGRLHSWGLAPWSARRPLRTLRAMISNWLNDKRSSGESVREQALGTYHLVAWGRTSNRAVSERREDE